MYVMYIDIDKTRVNTSLNSSVFCKERMLCWHVIDNNTRLSDNSLSIQSKDIDTKRTIDVSFIYIDTLFKKFRLFYIGFLYIAHCQ